MTAREIKHQYLLKEWADRISERSRSGLTIKEWCAEKGIKERVYHYWLRQVREYAAQFLPQKNIKPSILTNLGGAPSGWALAKVDEPHINLNEVKKSEAESIQVDIGGCRLTITSETDEGLLLKVCRVLRTLC